jgi:hypothetical protein
MSNYKWTFAVVLAALIGLAGAAGKVWSLDSHANLLTFSGPVALPGVSLGTGTYVFDHPGMDLNIVRVTSRDGRIVYYTGFTRSVERPRSASRNMTVTLGESPRGTPPPVKEWFPIGKRDGHQFIYPR